MKKSMLRKEILVMFAIKAAILGGLWFVCFSRPIDESLSANDVASHVVNPISPGESL
jgi:hypothetical protein